MALRADNHGVVDTGPALLTVEEAAVIARCSIKTVRRAYTTGALTAYRRRGSRAVLLDPDDVRAWARGELIQPSSASIAVRRTSPPTRGSEARARTTPKRSALAAPLRFDLSAEAIRVHRSSKTETGR